MLTTTRRRFLASVSAATAASGLVSLSPLAPRFLCEMAAAGAEMPGERILVVVQLSGGNDGLNTVIPYKHEVYQKERRASLAVGADRVLKVAGDIGLHPSLTGLATLLAGGLAFMLPIFVLGLVRLRIVTSDLLRRNRRIAFVALLVFAILLPTVDPVSLAFEVVPLVLLFELSIWLSVLMERRWSRDWGEDLAGAETP